MLKILVALLLIPLVSAALIGESNDQNISLDIPSEQQESPSHSSGGGGGRAIQTTIINSSNETKVSKPPFKPTNLSVSPDTIEIINKTNKTQEDEQKMDEQTENWISNNGGLILLLGILIIVGIVIYKKKMKIPVKENIIIPEVSVADFSDGDNEDDLQLRIEKENTDIEKKIARIKARAKEKAKIKKSVDIELNILILEFNQLKDRLAMNKSYLEKIKN